MSSLEDESCLIAPTDAVGVFALDLVSMDGCGVRACQVDGEAWLCVMVRFPIMAGLKLPEDEVIEIKCKPQDRAIEGMASLSLQKNL